MATVLFQAVYSLLYKYPVSLLFADSVHLESVCVFVHTLNL